jgi:alcohol dehydrogenase class IV
MVNSFRFARLPTILFRNGSIAELPGLTRKFGGPVVLVTGRSSFTKSERGKKLLKLLEEEDTTIYHVSVPAEPSPAIIDKAVDSNRDNDIKLTVAIGGGSVLDAGKSISAMLTVPAAKPPKTPLFLKPDHGVLKNHFATIILYLIWRYLTRNLLLTVLHSLQQPAGWIALHNSRKPFFPTKPQNIPMLLPFWD